MLSPLRSIARHGLDGNETTSRATPLPAVDWRRLLDGVRRHRLFGLLSAAVADGALAVSEAQRADVEDMELSAARTAVRLERALLDAVEVLGKHDIDHRLLKGPAVAHLDYGDPMLRHFGDIDLLVPANSLDTAAAALVGAGGVRRVGELAPGFDRRFGKGFMITSESGCELDVHRTFVAGRFGLRLEPADLFLNSTRVDIGDRAIRALGHEERFLHAVFHAALGDRRPRLTAVRDVVQIGVNPAVDWERVRALVEAWRCDAVVERALGQVIERLELQTFAEQVRGTLQLSPSDRDRRAVRAYLANDGRYARQALGAIVEIPGWRSKLAYMRSLAVPNRSNLQGRGQSRFAHLLRGARHAISQTLGR